MTTIEIGNGTCEDKLPTKHLRNNKHRDIAAIKSNCLTTFVKPVKRKDLFDNFKDLTVSPWKTMKKVHIDVCAQRHKQFGREVSSLEVLLEAVVISSDDESDLDFSKKEHEYGSKDFIGHHSDHVCWVRFAFPNEIWFALREIMNIYRKGDY